MATCLLLLLNNNGISRNPNQKKDTWNSVRTRMFKAGSKELVPVGQAHTYCSDGRLTSQQLQSSLFTTSSILTIIFCSLSSVDYQPQTASTSGDVRCPLTQL